MLTLKSKVQRPTETLFYDDAFRNVLYQHLPILKKVAVPLKGPSSLDQYINAGDFRMLLLAYGAPYHLHWLIMRLNDVIDPMDWNPFSQILTISEDNTVLSGLITLYNTNKNS